MTDLQAWMIIGLLAVITVLLLIIAVSTYVPGVLRTIWRSTVDSVLYVVALAVFGAGLAFGWMVLKMIVSRLFGP
jgi:hypothetical protein